MEQINAEVLQEVEVQDILELRPVVQYDNELANFVTNVSEMKEALKTGLEWYDYEVTEATLQDAKADRTKLNALEKAIADQRKQYALKFDKWKSINTSIMELEKMVKKTSEGLKRGIDTLAIKAEEEKRSLIKAYWDSQQTGIDYSLVDNPAFKNSGYTEKKWKEELNVKKEQIHKEKGFVKAMLDAKAEFTEQDRQQVYSVYNSTISQTEALNKIVEIEDAKAKAKAIEEQKRLEAEKQKEVQQYQEEHPEATLSEAENMVIEEPIWTLGIVCYGTYEQMCNLAKYIKEEGIIMQTHCMDKDSTKFAQVNEEIRKLKH